MIIKRHTAIGTILTATVIFFIGLLISARIFFAGASFNLKTAVISHLQSRAMNPHGYLPAVLGTAIAVILLLPPAIFIYNHVVISQSVLSKAGLAFIGLGIFGAIVIGILSPAPNIYEHVHIPLAFAIFTSLTAGIVIYMIAACRLVFPRHKAMGWALLCSIVFLVAVLLFILFLYFTPQFFDENSWLRNRALYEWTLSACLAACTVALILVLAKFAPANTSSHVAS